MADTNLPAIRSSSPMAEGCTVNIRPAMHAGLTGYQLRVWMDGAPIEDSMHPEPADALRRLTSLLVANVGLGALLDMVAGGKLH